MIKLDVEPYCHDCPAFSPVKQSITTSSYENFNCEVVQETTTYIRCEDWKRCKAIERYLRKQLEPDYGHQPKWVSELQAEQLSKLGINLKGDTNEHAN